MTVMSLVFLDIRILLVLIGYWLLGIVISSRYYLPGQGLVGGGADDAQGGETDDDQLDCEST
jgi:hypothetical protein